MKTIRVMKETYHYEILQDNSLVIEEKIDARLFNKIKQKLIRHHKYIEHSDDVIDKKAQVKRFKKWPNLELSIYYNELIGKKKYGLSPNEEFIIDIVEKELQTRNYDYLKIKEMM